MLLLFVIIVGLPIAVKSQLSDCSYLTLADLGSKSSLTQEGLLATSLNYYGSKEYLGNYYRILDFNVICLSQGSEKGKYGSASVIIAYFIQNATETDQRIGLFHFRCIDFNWTLNLITVIEKAVETSPLINYLGRTVNKKCWMCTVLNEDIETMNIHDHCLGKYDNLCDSYK